MSPPGCLWNEEKEPGGECGEGGLRTLDVGRWQNPEPGGIGLESGKDKSPSEVMPGSRSCAERGVDVRLLMELRS